MESGVLKINVGDGLDVVVTRQRRALPRAFIHILPDIAAIDVDGDADITVLVSADRLRTLLGSSLLHDPWLSMLGAADPVCLLAQNISTVCRVADEILRNKYQDTSLVLFIQSKVIELLVTAVADGDTELSNPIARGVRDALLSDPMSPPSLDDLAVKIGVSRRSIVHAFRSAFGMTVAQWLAEWRLLRARELAIATDLPMSEISSTLGYAHLSTFTAAFTKRFGMAPSHVRMNTGAADGVAPPKSRGCHIRISILPVHNPPILSSGN